MDAVKTQAGSLSFRQQLSEQPRALLSLCFVEMLARFGFAGLLSIFILYMVHQLHFPDVEAFGILGAFLATVYVSPLLGGWLADRYLKPSVCVTFGGLLSGIGMLALAIWGDRLWFDFGLAMMVWGYALILPNLIKLVGDLYQGDDTRRESGFTLYHMASMVGAVLGPLVCGFVGKLYGPHVGFAVASIGMFLSLPAFWFASHWRCRQLSVAFPAVTLRAWLWMLVTSVCVVSLIALLMMHYQGARWMIDALTLGCLGYMGILASACSPKERRNIVLILVLVVFYVVFETLIRQADGLLTVFTQHFVNRSVFGVNIPAPSFQSLESLWVAVLSPLFVWLWVRLSQQSGRWNTGHKFGIGLLMMAAAFGMLALACCMQGGQDLISWWWLVGCYGLQALSELCMLPIGLAMLTHLAPARFSGVFVGMWVVTAGIGGFLGARVGSWADSGMPKDIASHPAEALFHYGHIFQTMALWPALAALLLLLISPWLRRFSDGRF